MTIPVSQIVQVNPGVLSSGGAAIVLNGAILSTNTAIPIGSVLQFPSYAAVAAFFGATSTEAILAAVYFAGFDSSTQKPGNLLFSQYPIAPVAGYLRSASLAGMTLAQLQAIPPGTLTVSLDGANKTSSTITLSTATSFSNAAQLIGAAFTAGPTVAYDAQRQAFTFTSTTTGASSVVSFATGTLAAPLLLTAATGAVTSAGAIAATPAAAMTALSTLALNFASFMTTFEPVIADKVAFATWASQQNNRFVYACWDTDPNASVSGNTTAFGPQVNSLLLSGSVPIYKDPLHAAFVMGYCASVDFTRTGGRNTLAFRTQGGLVPSVQDQTVAVNLDVNGYNFYGAYANSAQGFSFMYPGSVGGAFAWLDSYINQIWMNGNFQTALITLLVNVGSIPYNAVGRAQYEQALADPINQAINFGAIRQGVTLSSSQIAQVNAAAGKIIDTTLSTRGWYLLINDASPAVRAARGSFPATFFYTDGGSVQALNLASIALQ